jgi:FkbM family methyltransferase
VEPSFRRVLYFRKVPTMAGFIRRLRPAPLAAAIGYFCGLSKRRTLRTERGTFLVNPLSRLGLQLATGRLYEPKMVEVLHKYLRPGSVFIDLGANEAYFSVIASRIVGPRGIVIAVEPQSRLQGVIRANLTVNTCYNVRVIQAVVSSQTGIARLQLSSELNNGGSSLFRSTRCPVHTEEVQSFTLAEFLSRTGIERCDLMKVDIEGAEHDVFMTAKGILRSGVIRNIALEIHNSILENRGLSGNDLHQAILNCGYRLHDDLGHWVYSFSRSPETA